MSYVSRPDAGSSERQKRDGEAQHRIVQPIVLLGGFASPSIVYSDFRDLLVEISGQPVWVVPTQTWHWFPTVFPAGWAPLLDMLERTVRKALPSSTTGQVTLIGHSAGGVLARLYLGKEPFMGRTFCGLDRVEHLVTLGSPHYNRQRWLHGGLMSSWIEERYPGATFSDRVRYTCVIGRLLRGRRGGSLLERTAYRFYRRIGGKGNAWGDGLIPVQAGLLEGARHIVLEGVSHFSGFGGPWYGSREIVPQWW